MPVRPVEVPELADLLLQRVRGEDPILMLDHFPHFEREPRERDRRGIPVRACLLLPSGPDLVVAPADRALSLLDALFELAIPIDPRPAEPSELGNPERGVAQRSDGARLHAAIVHRPLADVDLGKSYLDEVARSRSD